MTEQTFDTSAEATEDSVVKIRRSEIKSIQKKARERDELAAELEQARADQRELAFAKAGLPLATDKRLGYFVKGYDGELTPDAIRAAAEEAGFLQSQSDASPGQTTIEEQVEREAVQSIYSASQGAGAPGPGDDGGVEKAYQDGGTAGLMAFLGQQGLPISED